MQAKRLAPSHARVWLAGGWQLFIEGRSMWLLMAATYLVIALILDQIPFVGILIVVLLTPIPAAGALAFAAEVAAAKKSDASGDAGMDLDKLKRLFREAVRRLLSATAEPERLLSLMVIATLLLCCTVVVQILAELLQVGGAAVPAFFSGSVSPSVGIPALVSLLLVVLLKLILTFVMIFAVQLVVVDEHPPLVALEHAINACVGSALPLLGLGLVLVLPLMIAASINDGLGVLVGLIVVPLLVASTFCSYRELYA